MKFVTDRKHFLDNIFNSFVDHKVKPSNTNKSGVLTTLHIDQETTLIKFANKQSRYIITYRMVYVNMYYTMLSNLSPVHRSCFNAVQYRRFPSLRLRKCLFAMHQFRQGSISAESTIRTIFAGDDVYRAR